MTFLKKAVTLLTMTEGLSDQAAIEAALSGNWKEAIRINSALLTKGPDNIEVLNRLAYAYLRTGQTTRAKRTYQKVLDLDPYNQIALKNSKIAGVLKPKNVAKDERQPVSPLHFLEDPGKTKIASCVNLAPAQIVSTLSPGQIVFLKAKNHVVELRSDKNVYLAALPDDISFKLIKLLSAGNTYQVVIKGITKNTLVVIIRELSRSKRFANQPSFLSVAGTSWVPFAHPETGPSDKPDVTATGEEEERPGETSETT